MIFDIRAQDLVVLKDLSLEEKAKLSKFITRGEKRGYDLENYFKQTVLNSSGKNLIVESVSRTPKTKTEFATVVVDTKGPESAIRFKIQTRNLKLVKRSVKHPVTKIFADFTYSND